jgi:hypothetical protein
MDRETGLRVSLAMLFLTSTAGAWAVTLPEGDATDSSRLSAAPYAWTSAIGAVDAMDDTHSASLGEAADAKPAAWNAAFATYNLTVRHSAGRSASTSVFVPNAVPKAEAPSRAVRVLESLRTADVPVPAAWWLLLCGLIGVVGVARRRTA